jgi:hypothetical protein
MENSTTEIQFRLHLTGRPTRQKAASDGPHSGNGRLPRVAQVMALAVYFQDMILRGEARDYADLARLGCLSRERMSQVMELVWLAPDIQEEILYLPPTVGRYPISETAVRRIADHLSWPDQRREWTTLKAFHKLLE